MLNKQNTIQRQKDLIRPNNKNKRKNNNIKTKLNIIIKINMIFTGQDLLRNERRGKVCLYPCDLFVRLSISTKKINTYVNVNNNKYKQILCL
jgi:hypothetical protein